MEHRVVPTSRKKDYTVLFRFMAETTSCSSDVTKMDQEIMEVNVAVAHEKIKNGALLLDVRELDEIEMLAFDVESQILISVSELSIKHTELPTDREIIVGCHSGNRSLKMTRFLMDQNFNNVYNMKGGIRDWMGQGLPVKWEE